MPQIPAETIQTPAHDTLYAMTTHVTDEPVEGGPAVLRAGHSVVNVLVDDRPLACRNVPPQLE
jgi:hypothetical protein